MASVAPPGFCTWIRQPLHPIEKSDFSPVIVPLDSVPPTRCGVSSGGTFAQLGLGLGSRGSREIHSLQSSHNHPHHPASGQKASRRPPGAGAELPTALLLVPVIFQTTTGACLPHVGPRTGASDLGLSLLTPQGRYLPVRLLFPPSPIPRHRSQPDCFSSFNLITCIPFLQLWFNTQASFVNGSN